MALSVPNSARRRSKILQHFAEMLSGMDTLRAYGRLDAELAEHDELVHTNTRACAPGQEWTGPQLGSGALLVNPFNTDALAKYATTPTEAGTLGGAAS